MPFINLLKALPDALVLTDISHRILAINPAFSSLFGYTESDCIGQSIDELLAPPQQEDEVKHFTHRVCQGQSCGFQGRRRRKDGRIMELTVTVQPLGSPREPLGFLARYRDLREQKRAEHLLLSEQNLTDALLAVSPMAIVLTDPSQTILRVNPGFTRLFGFSQQEILGLNIDHLIVPEFLKEQARQISAQVSEGCTPLQTQTIRKTRKGDLFPVEIVAMPLDLELQRTGCLALYRDLSDQERIRAEWQRTQSLLNERIESRTRKLTMDIKTLHQELEELQKSRELLSRERDAAQAANEAKTAFLANMSHEIRTPLNAIIGMTSLLGDEALSKQQREWVEIMRQSGDALLHLVNDILDISRLSSGKLVLEAIDFDLRHLLEALCSSFQSSLTQKGLTFSQTIADEIPSHLNGDPSRLRQILLNLISNAIKFTHAGQVRLEVRLVELRDKDVRLIFLVSDTGIGIPRSQWRRIFEAYTQADTSTTRMYGGSGLGLNICRQLVQQMDGRMGLRSRSGKGSTFWFTLPFNLQESVLPIPPLSEGSDLSARRILLVEDKRSTRDQIVDMAKEWVHTITTAASGPEALFRLYQCHKMGKHADLVICSQQLAGMDGETLGRAIHSSPPLRNLPMILLSNKGRQGDAARAHAIGFSAYLTHPLSRETLKHCLLRVFAASSMRTQPSQQPQPLITQHSLHEEAQKRKTILLVEDHPINRKLALFLLQRFGYRAISAENGRQALSVLSQNDCDAVLMDLQMPEMDGLTATRHIRSGGDGIRNPRIPIIAMTAKAMAEDREQCLLAGMNDYLSKPIDSDQLRKLLETWTRGSVGSQG